MATQQHSVPYFNAPRQMTNNQQEVAEQPLLVPPQHAQQHAQAVLQQPQQAAQYFMAPTGYPMSVPVVPTGAPQQQAYMIYPSVPQQGGMAPQQIPVQYVLQPMPVPVPQQQQVPQQATQSVDITASVSSGCASVCERLKKLKRCCNPRKMAIIGAIVPFVIHALFTPLSFPWFLVVWLVMALVAGVKIINKKFAAMNDDDERKQHKCLAVHTLFFATVSAYLVFLNVRCCHFPWAAYPVLVWGMFYALHALRRLAPHKNTGINKHAIVFVTVQLLLFITWAYAFKGGNDRMMPPGPPQQPGHGPAQPPKPVQPGQGGAAPAQGWRHHGHHGGHGRHHGRFGGRHHNGGHHGHHGHHAEPVVAHQPMEQASTLQQAPPAPQPPQQPPQRPQPPQQPPQRPPQQSTRPITGLPPPQKPRRAIPFLFFIVPSLLFTIAFLIHARIHKKKQREAALAAAAQEQVSEASAPEQTAV